MQLHKRLPSGGRCFSCCGLSTYPTVGTLLWDKPNPLRLAASVELHTRSGLDRSDGNYGGNYHQARSRQPKYPSIPFLQQHHSKTEVFDNACAMNVTMFSNRKPGPGDITITEHDYFDDIKDKFEEVKDRFVMSSLQALEPLPVAVLDIAKLRVNCQRMIDATQRLGLLWRPHVKTHKVTSYVRLTALIHSANIDLTDGPTHPPPSRRRRCDSSQHHCFNAG